MKAFIAYRSAGEDPKLVKPVLVAITEALKARGIEAYCNFFDSDIKAGMGVREITEHALRIIDTSDFLFVIQTSDNKSEGMLIEVGYCLAKGIPIIVATKDTVDQTHLPSLATQSFRWRTLDELTEHIDNLQLR